MKIANNRLGIGIKIQKLLLLLGILILSCNNLFINAQIINAENDTVVRQRISFNKNWRFYKYNSAADEFTYSTNKEYVLPTGNNFVKDPSDKHTRPTGNPGGDFEYTNGWFDDSSWEMLDLPHDWAIKGPFQQGWNAEVGGSMGRLPSPGVAWYRKRFIIPETYTDKSFFLDIDGAMSYSMVWINGYLVGGWPYGYNSWRVDLTPYVTPGEVHQLAIRLDNLNESSRWYPGGGIYRNVWLTIAEPVHIGQWGTYITTREVSSSSATIDIEISIDNNSDNNVTIQVLTHIFEYDSSSNSPGDTVIGFTPIETTIEIGETSKVSGSIVIDNPKLWGPPPTQKPNLYIAVTELLNEGEVVDRYETRFGIRSVEFNGDSGVFINRERIYLKGVNQHHDLGALGAAFNTRAAERQLQMLQEMGCNAIRTAHNTPAPELLELTDKMGILVVDEIFDVWYSKKTDNDFHLIFADWHEQDLRAFVRRDRNSPSVIIWSFGNEVSEQYSGDAGASVARVLHNIIKEEDLTRPTTAAMNFAKPSSALPKEMDLISMNYQGEGIRVDPAYSHLSGITTQPLYSDFHSTFPDKVIMSSENTAALSTRGTYLFPVTERWSSPVSNGIGGDDANQYVSAYELYTANFGSSPDKVFANMDQHQPYAAGGFVWTGWDYLGEPTPYYSSRSSYFGIIDLAGFKKGRFYLYQSRWKSELPMAHILPHWNWPARVGQVTPVHVFTSGDEAELFLNGNSLGKKQKQEYEYRLRWDSVVYTPGELKVVAYKNGEEWAEDVVKTTGEPKGIEAMADDSLILSDEDMLSFVAVRIADSNGLTVPTAQNLVKFSIEGPGEIVATDNGDPTDMLAFSSHERKAFNGQCLVIIRGKSGYPGTITLTAESGMLERATITMENSCILDTTEYIEPEWPYDPPVGTNNMLKQKNFMLSQNYPNPFNTTTSITYSLLENLFVSLKVSTLTGQEITTLVNENKLAGTYSVQWDASNLHAGLYLYRIQVDGYSLTKKMNLMK